MLRHFVKMASKLLCLVLALFAIGVSADESRIVGGEPTTIEEFPYIVALVYYYPGPNIYVQRCVGSLVSSYHVLTTAFCFTGANWNQMLVRAGSTYSLSGGILATIHDVVKHPSYEESPRQGDIAVTVLQFPLPVGVTGIDALYLPPQNWYIPDGHPLKIVSWGFESDEPGAAQIEELRSIILNKLPLDECQTLYEDNADVVIDDPVICASQPGPVGMCLGDSGAPMVIDDVVVGLASWYLGCGDDANPNVFTRIDRYTDWILEVAVPPTTRAALESTENIKIAPTRL